MNEGDLESGREPRAGIFKTEAHKTINAMERRKEKTERVGRV